jgi:DNA-binding GntR family transcriptional regulator
MSMTPPLVFSLREQIADRLRADVLSGRLAEGERLSETQLVARFGVSRTPIREALQQLAQEGLLEGRPNAGVKVAHRPPEAIRDLVVPIRRSIEECALRSFFADIGPADYRQWNEILERMREACVARDFATIAEHDIAFHRSIIQRAGLRDLDLIWASLVARVRSHFWETQRNYPDPLDIFREHAALVEVFRRGDVEQAVTALKENIA